MIRPFAHHSLPYARFLAQSSPQRLLLTRALMSVCTHLNVFSRWPVKLSGTARVVSGHPLIPCWIGPQGDLWTTTRGENKSLIVLTVHHESETPNTKDTLQSKSKSSYRHQSTRERPTGNHSRRSSLASRAARKTRSSRLGQTAVALLRQCNCRAA